MYTNDNEDLFGEDLNADNVQETENDHIENIEDDNEQQDDNNEEGTGERTVIKPKRVLNPRPKLDAVLLAGPKGMSSIPSYFKNIKYKGKGHEEQDLNVVMKIYEHWCHRLFPKYPFEDCLAKIEKLGHKRQLQVYLKKLRMDIIESETRLNEQEDEDENFASEPMDTADISQPLLELTEEQLEQIRENKERAQRLRLERLQMAQDKAFASLNNQENDLFSQVSSINFEQTNNTLSEENFASEPMSTADISEPLLQLTEEQLERIRANKERAQRLRLEHLKKVEDKDLFSQPSSNNFEQSNNTQIQNMDKLETQIHFENDGDTNQISEESSKAQGLTSTEENSPLKFPSQNSLDIDENNVLKANESNSL